MSKEQLLTTLNAVVERALDINPSWEELIDFQKRLEKLINEHVEE